MRTRILAAALPMLLSGVTQADDTELYIADIGAQNGIRPQVMIIFDNSGSMRTEEEFTKAAYNPNTDYGVGSDPKVYWSAGSMPEIGDNTYFLASKNNCGSSFASLNSKGFYNGNIRRWTNRNDWRTLNKSWGKAFDCKEDIETNNVINAGTSHGNGYPVNGGPYQATPGTNPFRGSDGVTLYTENYVRWSALPNTEKKSRLAIAQETIADLVSSTTSVDFGLTVFNYDYPSDERDGGRVVTGIKTMTDSDRAGFVTTINAQVAQGNTPLCESLYEVSRYYAGQNVWFGDDDSDYGSYDGNKPPRDIANAENGSGIYVSPFQACQERAYVILMTDGQPTMDSAANSLISQKTSAGSYSGSYMPALAGWMNDHDIDGSSANGSQYVSTFTIGFGEGVNTSSGALLNETAKRGGGSYYPANDATALKTAFQETIIQILNASSSLSSPAIANNNFDRTKSLDAVYYSMFIPSKKKRWQGNIKKLKIDDKGLLRDANNAPAINGAGDIKETASTYWGGNKDGNTVAAGGVNGLYSGLTSRKLYTSTGPKSIASLTKASMNSYFNTSSNAELASALGVQTSDLDDNLNWLMGLDVNDDDEDNATDDYRSNVFGDPLHSKPLAINYSTGSSPTVRLLVGTNAGFVHMFTDNDSNNTVSEDWAFIPGELLEHGVSLKSNADSSVHSYGMDSSPVAVRSYSSSGQVERIIAAVGMRRGGSSLYGIDITYPDSPSLAWTISASNSGFSELGQTWSTPIEANVSYTGSGSDKPVAALIFGAGYDVNKDTCTPATNQSCDDSKGRGIYIINGITGEKIHGFTGGDCGDTEHCIRDSIAAPVAVLDSNADGNTDRIYAVDTGGNVWRADLNGVNRNDWTLVKVAKLGGDTSATDRRFFNEPVLVRTFHHKVTKVTTENETSYTFSKIPYDGVLVGSGNRASPASDTTTSDSFFMIQDKYILPTKFGSEDHPNPTPISYSDLYDITNNPVGSYTGEQVLNIKADLSAKGGWRYSLSESGEKSLGGAVVLEGTVYFTSFSPNATSNLQCGIGSLGVGRLHAVNLHSGVNTHSWREMDIGSRVPDTLVVHSGVNEKGESVLRLLGVGQGEETSITEEGETSTVVVNTGTVKSNADMDPKHIYSYFEEK